MNQNEHNHSVRRIVLPSGRSIEVVRFQETDATAQGGLHICPGCASDLVQPVSWSEAERDQWKLTLSCPNCWWCDEGQFDQDQVQQLEEKFDEGLAAMLSDLKRLAHANMAEQIDRFAAALQADLILPEDF